MKLDPVNFRAKSKRPLRSVKSTGAVKTRRELRCYLRGASNSSSRTASPEAAFPPVGFYSAWSKS